MTLISNHLEADLFSSLGQLARQPLAELLLQNGILRRLAADHVRQRLWESVVFSPEEQPFVIERLFQDFAIDRPTSLHPGWLEAIPSMAQGPLRERWNQIRLQKWMEEAYRDRVEAYFLERREDLEQVVYGMIRLRHQGAAEELYLRLIDDQADFGELAREYSLGDERFTRGLVGPMRISQPHPNIRAVLQKLAVGDLHPPFQLNNWILLVRMEHRQPAQLNDSTTLQLCQELLQNELDALLDERLPALYPALLEAFPSSASLSGEPAPASPSLIPAAPSDAGRGDDALPGGAPSGATSAAAEHPAASSKAEPTPGLTAEAAPAGSPPMQISQADNGAAAP